MQILQIIKPDTKNIYSMTKLDWRAQKRKYLNKDFTQKFLLLGSPTSIRTRNHDLWFTLYAKNDTSSNLVILIENEFYILTLISTDTRYPWLCDNGQWQCTTPRRIAWGWLQRNCRIRYYITHRRNLYFYRISPKILIHFLGYRNGQGIE